jgi:hypothetical protein
MDVRGKHTHFNISLFLTVLATLVLHCTSPTIGQTLTPSGPEIKVDKPTDKEMKAVFNSVTEIDSSVYRESLEISAYTGISPLVMIAEEPSLTPELIKLEKFISEGNAKGICDLFTERMTQAKLAFQPPIASPLAGSENSSNFGQSDSLSHQYTLGQDETEFTWLPNLDRIPVWVNNTCRILSVEEKLRNEVNEIISIPNEGIVGLNTRKRRSPPENHEPWPQIIKDLVCLCCCEIMTRYEALPMDGPTLTRFVTELQQEIHYDYRAREQLTLNANMIGNKLGKVHLRTMKDIGELLDFVWSLEEELNLAIFSVARAALLGMLTSYRSTVEQSITNARLSCAQNRFPLSIVTYSELESHLEIFQTSLESKGLTMTPGHTSAKRIADLPITHCRFLSDHVFLTLAVPTRELDFAGHGIKLAPYPYRTYSEVCTVRMPEVLLYETTNHIYELENDKLCQEHNLCLAREFKSGLEPGRECIKTLLSGKFFASYDRACLHDCVTYRGGYVVSYINTFKSAIIFEGNLTIECVTADGTHLKPIEGMGLGLIVITLTCGCSLKTSNGTLVIPAPHSCKGRVPDIRVANRIPPHFLDLETWEREIGAPPLLGQAAHPSLIRRHLNQSAIFKARYKHKPIDFRRNKELDRNRFGMPRLVTFLISAHTVSARILPWILLVIVLAHSILIIKQCKRNGITLPLTILNNPGPGAEPVLVEPPPYCELSETSLPHLNLDNETRPTRWIDTKRRKSSSVGRFLSLSSLNTISSDRGIFRQEEGSSRMSEDQEMMETVPTGMSDGLSGDLSYLERPLPTLPEDSESPEERPSVRSPLVHIRHPPKESGYEQPRSVYYPGAMGDSPVVREFEMPLSGTRLRHSKEDLDAIERVEEEPQASPPYLAMSPIDPFSFQRKEPLLSPVPSPSLDAKRPTPNKKTVLLHLTQRKNLITIEESPLDLYLKSPLVPIPKGLTSPFLGNCGPSGRVQTKEIDIPGKQPPLVQAVEPPLDGIALGKTLGMESKESLETSLDFTLSSPLILDNHEIGSKVASSDRESAL